MDYFVGDLGRKPLTKEAVAASSSGRPARTLPPAAAAAAVTLLAAALARRAAGSGGLYHRLGSARARRPRCCRSQIQDAASSQEHGVARPVPVYWYSAQSPMHALIYPPAILPAFCPTLSVILGHPSVRASRRRRVGARASSFASAASLHLACFIVLHTSTSPGYYSASYASSTTRGSSTAGGEEDGASFHNPKRSLRQLSLRRGHHLPQL